MIYVLSGFEIKPGKMAEYMDIMANESVPLYPKVNLRPVASWRTYTGNMNQTYSIFAHNDLSDLQKSRAMQQQDKDFQRVQAKLNALRVSSTQTILEPNAWSPIK